MYMWSSDISANNRAVIYSCRSYLFTFNTAYQIGESLWLKLPALCHWASTTTATTPPSRPYNLLIVIVVRRRVDVQKSRSVITASGGVQWTGLLYGAKTESGSFLSVDLWNGRGHERKVAPPGVEPRASGLISCQCSATEIRQPPATLTLRFLCFCGWNSVAKERWLASACLAVTTATV